MQFSLVNLAQELWTGEVAFVTAPGVEGELGIAPGHTPLLTDLAPGPVQIRTEDGEMEVFFISGGILEVSDGKVTLLADIAAEATDLSMEEAEEQLRQARADAADKGYDARIRAELIEATGRLHSLQRLKQVQRLKTRS